MRLGGGDLSDAVAEEVLVVLAERRHHREQPPSKHVGGIEPPAEPHLNHRDVHVRTCETSARKKKKKKQRLYS